MARYQCARWWGSLLTSALVAGCGGGSLAEMPQPSASSLSIRFDTPLTIGGRTSARATATIVTPEGKRLSTLGPLEASRPDDKGWLVGGSSESGNVYVRVDEHGVYVSWVSIPPEP